LENKISKDICLLPIMLMQSIKQKMKQLTPQQIAFNKGIEAEAKGRKIKIKKKNKSKGG